jgi:integrase/recombinase XerC
MWLSGRSPKTLAAYRQDLANFAEFLGAPTPDGAASALCSLAHGEANGVVLSYRNHLVESGLAPATVNRRLAALRSLVKLARTLGQITWTLDVSSVRRQTYKDTRGPGTDAVHDMLDATERPRDRAVLLLCFHMALRRGEVASLRWPDDVDLARKRLAILGKGRTEREWFSMPTPVKEGIENYLLERGREEGKLFKCSYRTLYNIVAKAGNLAGVQARPHGLRHSAITEALERTNGNVRLVQKFSRHSKLDTVLIYDDSRQDRFSEVADLLTDKED